MRHVEPKDLRTGDSYRVQIRGRWHHARLFETVDASPGFFRLTLDPHTPDAPKTLRHWRQIFPLASVARLPVVAELEDRRRDLLAWLSEPAQAEALAVLLRAEKLARGYTWKRSRARRSVELVSPQGYYEDGTMRCPYEDIRGYEHEACDAHSYSGCS